MPSHPTAPYLRLRRSVVVVATLAAALVLAAARPARAQSDSQLWLEAGVSHDVRPRVTLTFEQHLRFDDDLGRVAAIMPEPGVSVRLARWLRLGTSYRMQYERNGRGDLELRHRFHLFARARVEPSRTVRIEYRLQLQEQVRPDANDTYRHSVRNRVAAEYRGRRPWLPSASIELHHDLDNGDTVHLDKVWLTVGVARDLGKHELGVFYRAELPQFDPDAPTAHILGLGYHVDL